MRRLVWREKQPAVLDAEMRPLVFHGLATQHRLVDVEEFPRHFIALGVAEEDAVALVLLRIAAGGHVDQQPALGDAVDVAVMRAASVGDRSPGRTATRKRRRRVSGASADAMTQLSSQLRPVGSNAP
jgi:hypothetical protein